MPVDTEPITVLSWAAAALFLMAVWRVATNIFALSEPAADIWKRRWMEAGFLASAGLVLALLAFLLQTIT